MIRHIERVIEQWRG